MINLLKKWTIAKPSCFAPKERSAPKYLLCNRINWVSLIEEQRKFNQE